MKLVIFHEGGEYHLHQASDPTSMPGLATHGLETPVCGFCSPQFDRQASVF
jgi:hypothetical protein